MRYAPFYFSTPLSLPRKPFYFTLLSISTFPTKYTKVTQFTLSSCLILYLQLVAGLLGVESGQDAVIRAMLYERRELKVLPYAISVGEFTNRISELRNKLGNKGLKDEGLEVPRMEGAEGKVSGNVLAGDKYSLAFPRTPDEILRIVYGGGDEHVPGGFFPKGADGRIAKSYLKSAA